MPRLLWSAVLLLAAVVLLTGTQQLAARSAAAAVPTPTGPGAASVYSVTNLDVVALSVHHEVRADGTGLVVYDFYDLLPAGATRQYHLRDMPVPSPFSGNLTLTVTDYTVTPPFGADVVGYDYPPTATPSATATSTPTATAMLTKTPSPTPTETPAPTPTRAPYHIDLPMVVKEAGW